MIRKASPVERVRSTIDRRIWLIGAIICFFAYIVTKEVSLPKEVLVMIGGLGFLSLFMVGLQSPLVPFYVLVAYVPFSRVMVGHMGVDATAFNTTNFLMVWVFFGYILQRMSKRQPFFGGAPLNKLVWLFCLLGAASLLRAGMSYGSWYFVESILPLKRWMTPMLLYFLTLWVVREKRPLKTVVVIMMVVVTVVALMAIRDYMNASGGSLEKSRVGAIAENPNTLGAFFNYYMFLFMGFFLVYSKKQLRVWLLLIPLLLCFRGIMVTFSRGAYLGFAMGCLAACFFRNKPLFVLAVALGAIVAMHPSMLPAGIRYRLGMTMVHGASLETLGEGGDVTQSLESSAANRIIIWRGAVQMIKDHPWWGVGYDAFPYYIGTYTQGMEKERDAHNSYLLIAAEMGIPTLIVFFLVLFVGVGYTYWLYGHTSDQFLKATALGLLAGLFALLVANMFGSRIDSQEASSYFWILLAIVMRGILIEREERQGARGVRQGARNAGYRRPSGIPRLNPAV